MMWQYQTVLFEFSKNGLLGDRYMDDEEIEKTLNTLGREGWELVNVSLLEDGLLAILKQPLAGQPGPSIQEESAGEPAESGPLVGFSSQSSETSIPQGTATYAKHPEQVKSAEHSLSKPQQQDDDLVGGIRIS